jgi:hypothetical protein
MIVMNDHMGHMLPGVHRECKPIFFLQSSKERTDWMVYQLIDLDREEQTLLLFLLFLFHLDYQSLPVLMLILQKIEMRLIHLLMIVMM